MISQHEYHGCVNSGNFDFFEPDRNAASVSGQW